MHHFLCGGGLWAVEKSVMLQGIALAGVVPGTLQLVTLLYS
jgi:hypothetical protein